jgi:glycosyltransferase involved in cell wall biosynthesis
LPKIRVAFISNSAPFDGGSETFESSFASILSSIDNLNIEPILLRTQIVNSRIRRRKNSNLNEVYFRVGLLTKILVAFQTSLFLSSLSSRLRWPRNKFEKLLRTEGIQLAVFLSPNPLALIVHSVPLVTTVWDLGHRDLPDLPEFSRNNSFKEREFFYQDTLARSWRVLVDSAATKNRIEILYGVQPERVHIIGLLPAGPNSNSKQISFEMTSKYIFYPSQFWFHKNHRRLFEAFKLVLTDFPDLKLILTGSDKGSLSASLDFIKKMNLSGNVFYLGFVNREEYWWLLRNSQCLVFPTLLGPTNLPPLEAMTVGKSMTISEFHSATISNLKSNVIYFDPLSVESIANGIKEALTVSDSQPIDFKLDNSQKVSELLRVISNL